MKFLKKHARFLAVMIVLAVLLYFAGGQLADYGARVDAARARAKTLLTTNYGLLFGDVKKFNGEPATTQGRKVQDRTQVLQQLEAGRNEMLAFVTDPEYTVAAMPAGAGEDDQVSFYRSRVEALQRELALRTYFVPGVSAPGAFGFDATRSAIPAADIPEYLRKLDIVRTVAGSAGRTGVARLDRLKFVESASELSARGVPVLPAAEGEQPYLKGQGLEIDVRAGEEALYNFLAELQRPIKGQLRGRYISVEKFRLEKPDLLDPADDLIQASMTVVIWQVNEQSSYPRDRSAPEQQQTSARAPRHFR